MSITTEPNEIGDVQTTQWRIDPARSSVEFRTLTFWGMVTVRGRFARYDGTLDLQGRPAIDLTIEAASVDTQNKRRDKHLRSADFFDVDSHPTVRFVSDNATLEGTRLKVRGQLHARGSSIPLELEARLRHVGDELEVDASTYADHRELGMSHGALGMIRTASELVIHGRLFRDAAEEA
jgi:polyisoprenoid-binding protein YceI